MGFLIFIGCAVAGFVMYYIDSALIRTPGRVLQKKFISLGTLSGRSLEEIKRTCGVPQSVSSTADGGKLCQWIVTGYHIVLIFDANEICQGVQSETAV